MSDEKKLITHFSFLITHLLITHYWLFFASVTALSTCFCQSAMFFCASPGLSSYFAISFVIALRALSYFDRSCLLYAIAGSTCACCAAVSLRVFSKFASESA